MAAVFGGVWTFTFCGLLAKSPAASSFVDPTNIRRRLGDCSSPDEHEQTDIESCFDKDEDSVSDTNPTDTDTDIEANNEADLSWLYK